MNESHDEALYKETLNSTQGEYNSNGLCVSLLHISEQVVFLTQMLRVVVVVEKKGVEVSWFLKLKKLIRKPYVMGGA